MGDSAEFEKLGALEARLAAAIDRIASGVAARAPDAAPDVAPDSGAEGAAVTEANARADAAETAARDAEARAAELDGRVRALEARLTETQDALGKAEVSITADAEALDSLRARLEAREAETVELTAAKAALTARVAELEAAATAAPSSEDDADLAVMKRRVDRARAERDAAIEARDAAQDLADELSEAGGATPDDRVLALRAELRGLRATVDQVSSGLDELRTVANGNGGDAINRVLEAQVAALTRARKAEAAELDRILSDLIAAEAVREEEARNA